MSSPPIRCRALTKRYGDVVGVEGVDLDVPAGSITGFLGANGAGKTTLIRVIVGLLRATSGDALLWGTPAAEPESRRRLGFMPADPAFYPRLTGLENLDLLAAMHGRGSEDRAWAADLLELPEATLQRPVGGYSSGMVQKLALVQAVQHRPDLVILDEPANRLDPLAHRRFEELVRAIAADGRTVFLSSHTLSEVQDVCDRVAMIRAGRLQAVAEVAELQRLAARRVHAVYSSPPQRVPAGLDDVRVDGLELSARVTAGRIDLLRELLADDGLVDLTIEPPTLEDAFVELYEADAT